MFAMSQSSKSPRKTTADLFLAVKAYCARLPLLQAVKFAASLWGVSEEEAMRRLNENSPQAEEESKKPN
jgi:hypothetical protein